METLIYEPEIDWGYEFEDVQVDEAILAKTNTKFSLYNYLEVYNDLLPSNSLFMSYIQKYPKTTFFSVDGKYRNRLDLISREIYESPQLWWFLALFNNIIDPDDWDLGRIYYIEPSILYSIFDEFKDKGCNKINTNLKNLI